MLCDGEKRVDTKKKPNYVYFALCETSKWKRERKKSEMKMCLSHTCVCVCALIHIIIIFNISTWKRFRYNFCVFLLLRFGFSFAFAFNAAAVCQGAASTDVVAVCLLLLFFFFTFNMLFAFRYGYSMLCIRYIYIYRVVFYACSTLCLFICATADEIYSVALTFTHQIGIASLCHGCCHAAAAVAVAAISIGPNLARADILEMAAAAAVSRRHTLDCVSIIRVYHISIEQENRFRQR